jgi:hypothetical protein
MTEEKAQMQHVGPLCWYRYCFQKPRHGRSVRRYCQRPARKWHRCRSTCALDSLGCAFWTSPYQKTVCEQTINSKCDAAANPHIQRRHLLDGIVELLAGICFAVT